MVRFLALVAVVAAFAYVVVLPVIQVFAELAWKFNNLVK